MHFETVIGLEVHVELKTESKMFSPAPAHFGAEPNSNTNVIDLAYPGVLPVVNKRAVDWAMRAAMALNMDIATESKFDRKNYFYPDNPKAYQISQFDQPIGENGYIDIEVDGETKRIGITRLHMEEDAGKSSHKDGYSLVDLNRQGTPLATTALPSRSTRQVGLTCCQPYRYVGSGHNLHHTPGDWRANDRKCIKRMLPSKWRRR